MSTAGFQPPTNLAPLEEDPTSLITRGGSSDASLLSVSIDIAKRYPRDEAKILRRLKDWVDLYPQFSEKALYSIPYENRRTGKTVYVEGLSIRAAETLRNSWGNFRSGARVVSENEDGWDLQGIAFDMESNVWDYTESRAVKWEKTREGRVTFLDERRQLQARGAALSKLKRNVILGVLPMHVKSAFEMWVREKMAGGELSKPAKLDRVTACVDDFQRHFQVGIEKLEAYLAKPRGLWVGSDLAELRAVFNGLEAGESTLAEVFPAEEPVTTTAPPTGPVTVVEAKDGQLHDERDRPVAAAPPSTVVDLKQGADDAEPSPPASAPAPRPRGRPRIHPIEAPVNAPVNPVNAGVHPPEPKLGGSPDAAGDFMDALPQALLDAKTIMDLDGLLGKLYKDPSITRDEKRAALRLISARRDEIQRG
jgi:hypothetical protein